MLRLTSLMVIFAAVLLYGCGTAKNDLSADVVLDNGWIYTVDENDSIAEAVAIRGDRIVFVGSSEGVASFIGENTVIRDMDGQMVMPGIHDMHVHAMGTVQPRMCDLDSTPYSLEALVPVLKKCLIDYEINSGEWLIVLQWAFSNGNQPSTDIPNIRAALDAVSLDHPIFLYGDDGHHAAANSLALSLATNENGKNIEINAVSLNADYSDYKPFIQVDANGEPTGGISEDARLLIRSSWFEDMLGMSGDLDDTLTRVAKKMAATGITTLQDAIVTPETLAAYGRLEEREQITFRFRAAMVEPSNEDIHEIDEHLAVLSELRDQYSAYQYVKADGVKLFADAVLEGNPMASPPDMPVAALLENFKQPIFDGNADDGTFDIVGYVDQGREICSQVQSNPDNFKTSARIDDFVTEYGFYPRQCIPYGGVLEHEEAFVRAYIRKATEAGFNVHVHALSDKAVRIAVDEFGKVKSIADGKGTSQSLAHVQLAHPDDQKRIGELGIAVVFTFVWANPSKQYETMVIPFIDEVDGIEDLYNSDHYYMQNVYPARSIDEAGGVLVNGSDAPVGSRDPMPFSSLQAALYRSDDEVVLNVEQRIDIHTAIEAFTINGARVMGHEDVVGSIEVGKKADLIALSQNIVVLSETGATNRIADTQVTLTVFDGNIIFDSSAH